MLPRSHILFGMIFSFLIWLLFPITLLDASIIFLSSFLIDIDHYLLYMLRKKDFSLSHAYKYFYKTGMKVLNSKKKLKCPISFMHTAEFLILLAILSIFSHYLFLVFIGFLFHSILDIVMMIKKNRMHAREFSLINYMVNRKSSIYVK